MRLKSCVAIAGTHGKTTTTSLLTWILESAGLAPGYMIGGIPRNLGQGADLRDSKFFVIEGAGATEIAGRRFDWERNDIFVVPNFLWRRHLNTGKSDAVLYSVSDAPLMEKVGQYRVQGRTHHGTVENLVS